MAQSFISYLEDLTLIATRAAEVNPDANFLNGMNMGGTNAGGIGMSTENPNLEQSLPNWTLLDQNGNGRLPQNSQYIGNGLNDGSELGPAVNLKMGEPANNSNGDGSVQQVGNSVLADLATGWEI